MIEKWRVDNSKASGLTGREARRRLKIYGPNNVDAAKREPLWRQYIAKFVSPLTLILIVSAVISIGLGETISGGIIIGIVFASSTLDFVNSYRSNKAAEDLRRSVRVTAKVVRDGRTVPVPLNCIVPGDLVRLSAGSVVPADGETADSNALMVDESALTGESYPVQKEAGQQLLMGSNVTSGEGLMYVTATGRRTEFAKLASSLRRPVTTEFDAEISKFSNLITRITLLLVIFILAVDIIIKHDTVNSLLFALALAVGLTPELLPLIITTNLTQGSLSMARKGVIVKRLSAIQNMGAMDVFCTDKTGTLTENQISVAGTRDYYGGESGHILELAAIVCRYTSSFESPLDRAVLNCHRYNYRGYRKAQEIPFDFERKRESVAVRTPDGYEIITKGAADEMLSIVSAYRDKNGTAKRLTPAGRQRVARLYHDLSGQGYRVIMVASRMVDNQGNYTASDEIDMVFEGYIMFADPPKKSAKVSLARLRAANVQIKIVTGDDPLVAEKVASELGLAVDSVMTGAEASRMSRSQLVRRADGTTIFARVNPTQKLMIIEALKKRHVVGYMGDGINDAPSLRAADVGISVGGAVDVAKDTADIILRGKSLSYLYDGVIEGRRTFANTMKYLKMALSSNFGNMFSMAISSIFLPFLPMTASQILLNNLLYDASQLTLSLDNVDHDQLAQPRRMSLDGLKRFMLIFGPLSSLFDLITFWVLIGGFHATPALFQTGWFIESILTQVLVVFVIRTNGAAVKSRAAWQLWLNAGLISALALVLVCTPLGAPLGFVVLPGRLLGVIGLVVAAYLLAAEAAKRFIRI